ncbi:putative N utilization substance protein A [[Clostridium] ultunense Esp]|nr:putative N utilization substance protein A [[Clostridium] ultunense Esp]
MERNLNCLRCDNSMEYIRSEKIQLGQNGLWLGDIPNYIAGALAVDIYMCNECGKYEFFETIEDQIEQVECPNCGKTHDMDYPKCPYCKYDYYG